MMARLIVAAALIAAITAPAFACEWNKSAGADFSINHRRAIQRSTAEQAGAATQALLAEHLPTAACSNAKSQLSAQLARLRWQTVRLGLPDCSQSSD